VDIVETPAGSAVEPIELAPRRPGTPPRSRARAVTRGLAPYIPLLPSLVAFLVLLGYPVVLVVAISFQKFGLAELVQRKTVWIGLDNYRLIFSDPTFWDVAIRTFGFTIVNVTATIVLGTLVALMLERLGRTMRLLLSGAMVLAWATPALTGSVIFQWLFDSKFGVVNWVLTQVGIFGSFVNHSWFDTGLSTFFVITLIVVWQAIPFVAFSLYAGLLAISNETVEAARVDGAGELQLFRWVTLPMLTPLFLVLTFLSAIWDFKVFTQIYTVRQGGPAGSTTTFSIFAYQKGIAGQQFGVASAISVVMVLLLLVVLIPYIRRLIRSQEDM